eukprot:5764377-Amphidinium_carterae.1
MGIRKFDAACEELGCPGHAEGCGALSFHRAEKRPELEESQKWKEPRTKQRVLWQDSLEV